MKIIDSVSGETGLFNNTVGILFPDIPKEKLLIYDIDTTSFEAANGCVFLIGTMFYSDGKLDVRRFFSDNISDEASIIEEFLSLALNFRYLLSYKGDSFDIPFLSKRLYAIKRYDLYEKLSKLRPLSFDLYNEIHLLKAPLNFSSTKLDLLRKKLGQKTTAEINVENISRFYIEHISASKLRKLIDISNLPENTGFISDYRPNPIHDELSHISPDRGDRFFENILARNLSNMEAVLYLLRLSHLFTMRKGCFEAELIKDEDKSVTLYVTKESFVINIPLKTEALNLKQFYINFRDYYYFPAEDMAIHKSLAEFAGSSSKKKATTKTAYRKVSGDFIRIPKAFALSGNAGFPNYYKISYEDGTYYLPFDELMRLDTEAVRELAYYLTLEQASDDLSAVLVPI